METSGSAVQVITIEEQIAYHLEYNSSFPMPQKYIVPMAAMCAKAIEACNDGDVERLIPMPDGAIWRSWDTGIATNTIPAMEAVAKYSLTEWLDKTKWGNIQWVNVNIKGEG